LNSEKIPFNTGISIALYGGTFDPIHNGHLKVIEKLAPKFDLVMVIPANTPQLRSAPTATPAQRLMMCELALSDLSEALTDKVVVSDIEIARKNPTYTFDTLQELRAFFPQDNFTIVMGSDAAHNFGQWKRAKDLEKMAKILVIKRPGEEPSNFKELEIDALDISASQIRADLKFQSTTELLPKKVLSYILENGLYQSE
jgi:nicotinate-nucleotide adenylyltransferase